MTPTEQTRETVTVLGVECRGEPGEVRGECGGCDVRATLYPERVASWGQTLPPRWQVMVYAPYPVTLSVSGYGPTREDAEADARATILSECPRIAERLGLRGAA